MIKDLEAIKYLNDTCINFLDRTKELYCTVTFTRKRAEILRDNIAEVEKSLKALEIIKEKNVDILDVKLYENYEHYCTAKEDSRLRKDWWLTQEEFKLLKEVLE